MALVNKNANLESNPSVEPTRKDSTAARIGRFAVGSIFGIIFMIFCFVMLSVALKGPDTIKVDGVTAKAGLVGNPPAQRLKVGDPAPDFVLEQLGGEAVQLSKLRGKTVFVNFWASWCDPCREEMPDIQRFYQKYKTQDVVVLAVNIKDSPDAAKSYFKNLNLTMPVLLDKTGAVPGGYRVTKYPESYFIDKNGNIGELSIGALSFEAMEQKLKTTMQAAK